MLIIYDEPALHSINYQSDYLLALQEVLSTRNQADIANAPLQLHWLCVANNTSDEVLTEMLLDNVELGVQVMYSIIWFVYKHYKDNLLQGYISVLKDADRFLRLKSNVQQISDQRLRDMIFLFLSDTAIDVDGFFSNDAFNCKTFIMDV